MIGSLGLPELGIILVIALLIFGPKALPSLGKSIGDGVRNLKKGLHASELDDDDEDAELRALLARREAREAEARKRVQP